MPDLAHIDVATALGRLGNNVMAYEKLLRQFASRFQGAVRPIVALIDEGKIEAAERQAHALKGVAGNIGAQALFATATEVNQTLHQGEAPRQEVLMQLEEQLEAVIADILKLPDSSSEVSDNLLDEQKLLQQLKQLPIWLEQDLGAANEAMTALEGLPVDHPWRAQVMAISERVDDFDFDAAKDLIQHLVQRIEEGNREELTET
jgi:HPt (histidine-containing phosphotransfer) domain-containing protein